MNTKSKKPASDRDRAFQGRTGRLRKRGLVTIPRDIFENLKLHTGDLVIFTIQKNSVVVKPKRVVAPDRTLANLIKETKAEQAKKPMAMDKILAESKRLARAGAKRAEKLGVKTDLRSATNSSMSAARPRGLLNDQRLYARKRPGMQAFRVATVRRAAASVWHVEMGITDDLTYFSDPASMKE